MATYVFSDVHGHYKTLDRLLERVSPASDDEVWTLGDMVDRGPDPISVMRACRDLCGDRVLMGNHEDMMLDALIRHPGDELTVFQWELNGGYTTRAGLEELSEHELVDLLEWTQQLRLGTHVEVGERTYIMVHAGLRPLSFSSHSRWTDATIDALIRYQSVEDVLWIREDFWGRPTGFINDRGEGPIVIAGHTPVPYVEEVADVYDRTARDDDGHCRVMHLGACEATGGVADRWAIDCGAAGGAGWGSVAMVRLDDGVEFLEPVLDGE